MELAFQFMYLFGIGIFYALPILIFFCLCIVAMGLLIGKKEGWSKIDAIYYAFITATTVGYGDFHPQQTFSKFTAIGIALVGLLMTGIIVAIGVKAGHIAFKSIYDVA